MSTALEGLLADGVIDAIIGQLKSGKEAEVWLVEHQGEIVAAKLYKERHARNFRNNAGYREGREVRSSRTARAMAKGSRFGVAAAEEAWRSAEVDALYALHAAGVRVPAPVVFYEGVLLMELVIDPGGHPAPRLIETPPASPAEAEALYEDLRTQVIRMLAIDLVHGDLSAYNILSAWNGPTLIDFPQTIAAAKNTSAERYFKRDMDGVRVYLAGFAPSLVDRDWETEDIWRAYLKGELSPEYVPNPANRKHRLAEAGRRGVRRGARGGLRDDPTPPAPIQATHFDRSAFSAPEPAPVVPSARPGETDEEAELRALEATLLRQGGGSRGKPPGASKDEAQARRGRGGPRTGGGRGGPGNRGNGGGGAPRGPAREGARSGGPSASPGANGPRRENGAAGPQGPRAAPANGSAAGPRAHQDERGARDASRGPQSGSSGEFNAQGRGGRNGFGNPQAQGGDRRAGREGFGGSPSQGGERRPGREGFGGSPSQGPRESWRDAGRAQQSQGPRESGGADASRGFSGGERRDGGRAQQPRDVSRNERRDGGGPRGGRDAAQGPRDGGGPRGGRDAAQGPRDGARNFGGSDRSGEKREFPPAGERPQERRSFGGSDRSGEKREFQPAGERPQERRSFNGGNRPDAPRRDDRRGSPRQSKGPAVSFVPRRPPGDQS